jgi:hypothetical protein
MTDLPFRDFSKPESHPGGWLSSLRGELLFLFLVLALLPVGGVSALLVWQSQQALRQQAEANLKNVAEIES